MKASISSLFVLVFLLLLLKSFNSIAQCPSSATIIGPTTICAGSTIFYTSDVLSQSTGSNVWTVSGGGTVNTNPGGSPAPSYISISWTAVGTHTITYRPIIFGCSSPTATLTVNVVNSSISSSPTISGPSFFCTNSTVTYSVPNVSGLTPQWYTVTYAGTPPTITPSGNQVSVTSTVDQYFQLFATYSNGVCTGAQSFIFVNSTSGTVPVSLWSEVGSSTCLNSSTLIRASGNSNDFFSWSLPSGGILTPSGVNNGDASIQWNTQGTFIVTATATNSCNATPRSQSMAITVAPPTPPTPGNITIPSTICPNTSVPISVQAVAGATNYKWNITSTSNSFSFSSTSNSTSYSFEQSSSGSYSISVNAGNGTCFSGNSAQSNFTVLTKPLFAPSTSGPALVCLGSTQNYSVLSIDPTFNYTWSIVDAATNAIASPSIAEFIGANTGSNVQIKFNALSSLSLFVTATNSCGSSVIAPGSEKTIVVSDNSIPTITQIIGPNQACIGEFTYIAQSPSQFTSYSWSVNSGGTITNNTNVLVKVRWNSPGTHTVSVLGTTACGQIASSSININVISSAKPYIMAIQGKGACVSDITNYKAIDASGQSPTNYNYAWEFSNPVTGTLTTNGANATVTYLQTGTGELSVTPSVPGCVGDKVWAGNVVYVYPYPIPIISSINGTQNGSNITRCGGGAIILKSSMENGNQTFQWKINGQLVGGSAGIQQNLAVNTPSTASVIVTNSLTCSTESSPVDVSWIPRPEMNPIPIQVVCSGGTLNYTPTLLAPVPGTTFQWDGPNGRKSGSSIVETFGVNTSSQSIPYNFTVYSFYNGCNGNVRSMTVYLNPIPILTSALTASVCSGSTFNYSPALNNSSSISWTRAFISGIAEGASSGTSGISEVLTNMTNAPIDVTYVFSLTSTSFCSNTQNVVVTVNPIPTLTSSLAPQSICTGSAFIYLPTTNISGSGISWKRAAISGIDNPAMLFGSGDINETLRLSSGFGPTNAKYVITPGFRGCSGVPQEVIVTVNPYPNTSILNSPGFTTFCADNSVTLSSNSGSSSYLWSTGAITQSINVNSSGDYSVTVTRNGCSATSSPVTITVNPLPIASISTSGTTTLCQGGSVTLTASSATTYIWSTGARTQSITVNSAGTYTVQVANSNSCWATSAPTIVTVNALPTTPTIATSGATTFCQGGSVTLTSSSGSSYLWSTGATTQSITVSAAGSYTVSVTNANGCSATSAATSVMVNPYPTAPTISTSGPTTFCQGGSVTLTSSTGNSYLWSNGATTQAISVSASGNYTVTTSNANGCTATSAATAVTVTPGPVDATISANTTSICLGQSVTISSTGGTGTPYYWASTNGGSTWNVFSQQYGGQTSFNYTPTAAGTYRFHVRNLNSCGFCFSLGTCTTFPYVDVVVNPVPTATISGPTTFCQGGSVTLTSSTGNSYLWSNGATTQAISVSASGNYTVTTSNANGCTATSAATAVTLTPGPVDATISANTTSICLGQSVTISSTGGTSTPYYWASTNGGSTWNVFSQQYGGQTSFNYTPTAAGTYRFHVRNLNSCGFCFSLGTCTTFPYVDVVVNPVPTATISGPTNVCTGSSASYTAPTGMSNYNWSIVNGTINSGAGTSSVSVTWQSAGSLSLTYMSGGCATSTATINVSLSPGGRILASPGTNLCQSGSVFLTAPSGSSYTWSTGQTSQSITVYDPATYSVFVSGVCSRNYSINVVRTGSRCTYLRQAGDEPVADAEGEPDVEEVTVFPNPATKVITVALPEKLKEEKPVYLYDMMGRAVISSNIPQGKWKVQLALVNVPAGIYLVKVGYRDYGVVKKVMVVD